MPDILEELQNIFRDVFDIPGLLITRDTDASSIEDWDSLTHINLVTAVEKYYKIRFALGELEELKNVGDMVDLIGKKLASQ